MASKKQRRRQQKLKRHEYEEVYVDEDGNVLPPEQAEELARTASSNGSKPGRRSGGKAGSSSRPRPRTLEPPSLRRTAKRGLLFFPLLLAVIFFLPDKEGATTLGKVLNAVVLLGIFLPFSHVMDTVMWRTYQRRLAKQGQKID